MHANRTIVLVEDDAGVRQAIERILRCAGYDVAAYDSAEALQDCPQAAALCGSCFCLVCDVRLPGLSGFELHRRLSELGPLPPWVFITAHDDPGVRMQVERDGASYLLKPFAGRALLSVLEKATQAG